MHRAWINTNLLTEYLNNAIIFVAFCFSVLPQSQLIIDILIVYLIYSGVINVTMIKTLKVLDIYFRLQFISNQIKWFITKFFI
jgi:hypothetical protein